MKAKPLFPAVLLAFAFSIVGEGEASPTKADACYERAVENKRILSSGIQGRGRVDRRIWRGITTKTSPSASIRDWSLRNGAILDRLRLRVAQEIQRRLELFASLRAPASCSNGIAKGDFNGDGFADLAIGIPGQDGSNGSNNSGGVTILYGSRNGLVAATARNAGVPAPQFFSQDSAGIPGANESNDRFGAALASGEFNGDDFSDLAIGVPGEDVTVDGRNFPDSGSVVILYGSPVGLAATGPNALRVAQSLSFADGIDLEVLEGLHEFDLDASNATFGQTLAWGDFNGDTIGDLAIGAPNCTVPGGIFKPLGQTVRDGAVLVLFGSLRNGIVPIGGQLITNFLNIFDTDAQFGSALAAGDMNGDGVSDLAIGSPNLARATGTAWVFPGTEIVGMEFNRSFFYVGFGHVEGDRVGSSLVMADFDQDGFDDLAIGAPGFPGSRIIDDDGSRSDSAPGAGKVFLNFGSANPPSSGLRVFDQRVLFGSGRETGDRFGFSLAAGDFNGDQFPDLAVGVPLEDSAGRTNVGEVNVIYGSSRGLSESAADTRAPQRLTDVGIQTGAQFGRSLSAWNFGRNESQRLPLVPNPIPRPTADLAIGVPFKDVSGRIDAGAMRVLYGSFSGRGLTLTGEQEWTEDSPGVPGSTARGDQFGSTGY